MKRIPSLVDSSPKPSLLPNVYLGPSYEDDEIEKALKDAQVEYHRSEDVHAETGGAFDITIGPLMDIYRRPDGTKLNPSDEAIESALTKIGIDNLELDRENMSVTSKIDQPRVDLGGLGKGYTLDQMAALLREWSIEAALLNAGDSTVLALGQPRGEDGWGVGAGTHFAETVRLHDNALSGYGFSERGSHIIDPRTGRPVPTKRENAWAIAPTASLADALSTAFLVMAPDEVEEFCASQPPEISAIFPS